MDTGGYGTTALHIIVFIVIFIILIILIVNAVYWDNVYKIINANGSPLTSANPQQVAGTTITISLNTANSLFYANVITAVILGIVLLIGIIYAIYYWIRRPAVVTTATTIVATPTTPITSETTTTTSKQTNTTASPTLITPNVGTQAVIATPINSQPIGNINSGSMNIGTPFGIMNPNYQGFGNQGFVPQGFNQGFVPQGFQYI